MKSILTRALVLAEIILFSFCIYATTSYSVNPKQREVKHAYSDMEFLYFTNISLYLTILTGGVFFLHKMAGVFSGLVNQFLSIVPVFNYITTTVFWLLYFTKRELIINEKNLRPGYETYLITELSLHLFPFLLLFLQHLRFKLHRSKIHYYIMLFTVIAYGGTVHIAAYYKKRFIYGFLNVMSIDVRIMFFAGMYGFCILFYNITMLTNSWFCLVKKSKQLQHGQ